MTTPTPAPMAIPLTGNAEVRQDPTTGAAIVVLWFAVGPMRSEFFIDPTQAAQFGAGLAQALATAAERAASLTNGLMVPPKSLIIPQNGRRPTP